MIPASDEGQRSPAPPVASRRRVLIRLPNWIGDAIMAWPSIQALGEAEPDWEWNLLGVPRVHPLFEGLEEPFHLLPALPTRPSRPSALLRAAARLRSGRFEAVLVLPPSFSSAAMVAGAGIPVRVGWPTEGRRGFLNAAPSFPGRVLPLRESYAQLARRLHQELTGRNCEGPATQEPETAKPTSISSTSLRRLPLRPSEISWADQWWQNEEISPERTVALSPGATFGATKRWPEEHYRELGSRLRRSGWNLLWMGGAEERSLVEQLARDSDLAAGNGTRSLALAGELGLRQSLAILSRTRAAVSNDSGALHLAQAAGCPVLGLYGSTSPRWTGPVGERQRILYDAIACSPCFARTCPTQIECLSGITVSRAERTLYELLDQTERMPGRPAIFLDRDGTLLEPVAYLNRTIDVRLVPGAGRALRRLQAKGFALVLVTNQSAIARGLLDRAALWAIHRRMAILLESEGVRLDGIEVCPHHPDFTGPCACRKPEAGLLRRAAHRLELDLNQSTLVGDGLNDLQAGRTAGVQTVLVRSGYGRESEAAIRSGEAPEPDAVVEGLEAAASWVLGSERRVPR